MCRNAMRSPRRRARNGAATILLLVVLTILLAAFAVAVNVALLWNHRAELQVAADASAHAGAGALVDDDQLRGDPTLLPDLLARAGTAAEQFAQKNLVRGRPFVLPPNPSNDPNGDLVFGNLETPRSKQLGLPGDLKDPNNAQLAAVNTVRVVARLTRERGNAPALIFGQFTRVVSADVQAAATVTLDRDVIGFRPLGQRPLALAPIALLSGAADPRSWEFSVEAKNGPDQFTFDRSQRAFASGPDQLHEFQAVLALDPSQAANANASLLHLGVQTAAGVSGQLQAGVTVADLADLGGQIVLDTDNRLTIPGTSLGPAAGSADLSQLHEALDQLRQSAEPRIWPLYCGLEGGTSNPVLCGFVAARVVAVAPPAPNQPLGFTLQPAMISNASAVTDASRRGVNGTAIVNPYICKVRFVE